MLRKLLLALVICAMLPAYSCSKKEQQVTEETRETKNEEVAVKELKAPEKPDIDVEKRYTATIKTEKGDIVCELFVKEAPLSVTNFKNLAERGFYKDLTFHRVVPGFVVQGGDPTATGTGGPGYTIPAEISKPHLEGALAWARTGDEVNPERRSSGSQFYITLKPTHSLDGAYTVFGQTISGQDVVT